MNNLQPLSKSGCSTVSQPAPQTGLMAQGSQAEPALPPGAGFQRDQIGEVDEVSLGREIPLRRGYGLPPPGNTCQDVTGNPLRGFPRSDLGWLHPNLDMNRVSRAQDGNPCLPTSHAIPRRTLSSASWRNMEGVEFSVFSYILLAAVENSL